MDWIEIVAAVRFPLEHRDADALVAELEAAVPDNYAIGADVEPSGDDAVIIDVVGWMPLADGEQSEDVQERWVATLPDVLPALGQTVCYVEHHPAADPPTD